MSHKRLAVVVTVAALALSACSSQGVITTAQPTPDSSGSAEQTSPSPFETEDNVEFGAACEAFPTDPNNPGSFEAMATQPVAKALAANPELFSTLTKALETARLTDALNYMMDDITVFAVTNEGFDKLPRDNLDLLMAQPELLADILGQHVVPKTITPDQLAGRHEALRGYGFEATGSGTDFMAGELAKVICGNVKTGNATVYVIDDLIQEG